MYSFTDLYLTAFPNHCPTNRPYGSFSHSHSDLEHFPTYFRTSCRFILGHRTIFLGRFLRHSCPDIYPAYIFPDLHPARFQAYLPPTPGISHLFRDSIPSISEPLFLYSVFQLRSPYFPHRPASFLITSLPGFTPPFHPSRPLPPLQAPSPPSPLQLRRKETRVRKGKAAKAGNTDFLTHSGHRHPHFLRPPAVIRAGESFYF